MTHSKSAVPIGNGHAHLATTSATNPTGGNGGADMKGRFYSFTEAFDKPEKLNTTPVVWVDPKPLFRVAVSWASTVYR